MMCDKLTVKAIKRTDAYRNLSSKVKIDGRTKSRMGKAQLCLALSKHSTKSLNQYAKTKNDGKKKQLTKTRKPIKAKYKTKQQIPPDCKQIKLAVKWMRSQGVKSKLAMFNILDACSSKSFSIDLVSATQRWLKEKEILKSIHLKAQKFVLPHQKATFFALNSLYYLQFGHKSWEENAEILTEFEPSCPYTPDAKNFIITLVETNQCLCLCYTNYVVAAGEEFGYEKLIYSCHMPGHINIVIVYPDSQNPQSITYEECKSEKHFFLNFQELNICIDGKKIKQANRYIYCELDSGFKNNWYMNIKTTETKQKFQDLYIEQKNVFIQTQKKIVCNENFYPSPWNVITSVFRRIAVRKDKNRLQEDLDKIIAIWGTNFSLMKRLGVIMKQRWSPAQHHHPLSWEDKNKLGVMAAEVVKELLVDFKRESEKLGGLFPQPTQLLSILKAPFNVYLE